MGTVTKALSLLNHFSQTRTVIGLSDMTRLSGMKKATVYRMLSELQAQGFVEQTGADRAYRLGAGVLRLATLREAAVPLLDMSREILGQLSAQTCETAHMSVVRGHHLSTLAYSYSPAHATKVTMEDAEELAFHATASGLAVLAFADPAFADARLVPPLPRFTDATLTDPAAVRAAMDACRESGISEAIGGFEDEVHAFAAPVFDADRRPIGAVAVAAPHARVTPDKAASVRTHLAAAAMRLTEGIGGFYPEDHPLERAA